MTNEDVIFIARFLWSVAEKVKTRDVTVAMKLKDKENLNAAFLSLSYMIN